MPNTKKQRQTAKATAVRKLPYNNKEAIAKSLIVLHTQGGRGREGRESGRKGASKWDEGGKGEIKECEEGDEVREEREETVYDRGDNITVHCVCPQQSDYIWPQISSGQTSFPTDTVAACVCVCICVCISLFNSACLQSIYVVGCLACACIPCAWEHSITKSSLMWQSAECLHALTPGSVKAS